LDIRWLQVNKKESLRFKGLPLGNANTPSVIRKGFHTPITIGRQRDENGTEKTGVHSFLLRIAKMAKLSQYCTSLVSLKRVKFNRFGTSKIPALKPN